MPTTETAYKNVNDANQGSSLGYDKLLSLFNKSNESSDKSKQDRVRVVLKDQGGYINTLKMATNDTYQSMAGCDLSAIFLPFQTTLATSGNIVGSGADMPCFHNTFPTSGNSGQIDGFKLLPFVWNSGLTDVLQDRYVGTSGDSINYLVSAEQNYGNVDRYRDLSDIRGVGLRLPAMGVGWGYTTAGAPWPSGDTSGVLFAGGHTYGRHVDPQDYVAAPIDLRYDTGRNVWGPPVGFFAEILGYGGFAVTTSGTNLMPLPFWWQQMRSTASGFYPSSNNISYFGTNIYPYDTLGLVESNGNAFIPSGTIVWVEPGYSQPYIFTYSKQPRTFAAQIINYVANLTPANSWLYTFVENILSLGGGTTYGAIFASGSYYGLGSGLAINVMEQPMPNSTFFPNGIRQNNVPNGFYLQPIPSGAMVMMVESPIFNEVINYHNSSITGLNAYEYTGQVKYIFGVPNSVDGTYI